MSNNMSNAKTAPILSGEELLTLAAAVEHLPSLNGRQIAVSTIYRWCRNGIRGIRLEHARVGRSMATSREALERFFAALAADDWNRWAEKTAAEHNRRFSICNDQKDE